LRGSRQHGGGGGGGQFLAPHGWDQGYRGRDFCNTTWNLTEEDKNLLQKSPASNLFLDISLHPYSGITSAVKVFSFSMALRYFWYSIFTKNSQKLSFPISFFLFFFEIGE
jgi:hypothetical protein